MLSLLHWRSPPPHAARDCARAAAGPSTFWLHVSQWVSLSAPCCSYCSYWLHIVWHWLENTRIWAESLEKSRFSRLLFFAWLVTVGPHVGPEAWLEVSRFPQHNLLITMIDKHLWNIWWKESHSFLDECYFWALLRNRSKFEDVDFSHLLALDLQTLHRGEKYTETKSVY